MPWPLSRMLLLGCLVLASLITLASFITPGHTRPVAAALPMTGSLGPLPPLPSLLASPTPTSRPAPSPPAEATPTPEPTSAPTPPPQAPSSPVAQLPEHPCGNHFARGFCTWWAAEHRCIPWFGDAASWLAGAARMGYAVSRTPMVDAIAVWGRGEDGASWSGHVGLVVAVGHDGTFVVSEMNWSNGWDRVDDRLVRVADVLGFILPRPA